jgi:beta-glucanase (GH16 family)
LSSIATVTGTSYSSVGLIASAIYSFAIVAYDAIGNTSGLSNTAFATTQSNSSNVITPIDSSYNLVFDDEFNGTTLDTTTNWFSPSNGSDTSYGGRTAQYVPSTNIVIGNGCLDMMVTRGPTPNGSAWGTAGLSSRKSTNYGYFEARMRMAKNAHGIANVFWTDTIPSWNFPEIDFSEWWGATPLQTGMWWHPTGIPGSTGQYASLGFDPSQTFHVYGVLWIPTAITWYIDGRQVFQATGNTASSALMFDTLIGATVGGNGLPDGTTTLPSHFLIDYIHVYSQSGTAITPQANYGGPGDASGSTSCS